MEKSKVKIMVDSGSDLTSAEAKELGILFVPISVQFGEEEFLDGQTIFAEEFYKKLEDSSVFPRTSLINSLKWEEELISATADGSDVVVITLSSKLSGTYKQCQEAGSKFNGKVRVVDSLNAAYGEAVLAIYAKQLADKGLSAQEIEDILNEKKKDICVYAVVDTLKYLKKGGRISATSAIIGTMLNVKPLLAVIDGEVKMVGKAIGSKKAYSNINELIKSAGGVDLNMPFGYIYSGLSTNNIQKYKEESAYLIENREAEMHNLGCTIGSHVGQGAVGLVFYKNK